MFIHPALSPGLVALACLSATPAFAGQPLETETARLPTKGHGNVQAVFEYQTSSDGHEAAVPLVFEYGITDRLEIAVEPVAFASIRPKAGKRASGIGDTEVTLTYLLSEESGSMPAIAIAAELKIPTTKNTVIGTGKADYRLFGIVSRKIGRFDIHANLGYTIVGSPTGTKLDNIFDYALASEYEINPKFSLVAEVIGNTSSGGSESTAGVPQEAVGSSIVGLIGGVYRVTDSAEFSLGTTYDNSSAFLIRTGLTFKF
jgi:hypothetical protein